MVVFLLDAPATPTSNAPRRRRSGGVVRTVRRIARHVLLRLASTDTLSDVAEDDDERPQR
jgi:hypothetical protein